MTMTTTTSFAPKIQKIIDAAKSNDWQVEIVEDAPHYVSFKVIHPSPGEYDLAYIHLSFYESDGSWRFDGANKVETTRNGGLFPAGTLTMRDSLAIIDGARSPRKKAAAELDEMARVARREALAAAYKAETDLPIRHSIRVALIHMVESTFALDKFNEEREKNGLQWACEQFLEDALIEQHLARQAQSVLDWEGNVDQKGTKVTSLEEAIVRYADGALTRVLGHATRGSTGSTSKLRNAWTDIAAVADAKFVERFHPLQGSGGTAWQIREILDPEWLGATSRF